MYRTFKPEVTVRYFSNSRKELTERLPGDFVRRSDPEEIRSR